MRPAKGKGFVALEAHYLDGSSVTLIQSPTYNERFLEWLLAQQENPSSAFGQPVTVEDWGSDY
jgi:hypothetical protein